MTDHQQAQAATIRLPKVLLDRLSEPLGRFLSIEAASGAVLLAFAVAAVVLSNSPWAQPFLGVWETRIGFVIGPWEFTRGLRDWINDALMTFFFFLVSLELKRELALGELRSLRMASLSISAAAGGMLVPAALYLVMQSGQPGQHGWGSVMATDTAFVIGCLALLGSRIPQSLRIFMLSLAVVDDIGAILVVVFGYSSQIAWAPLALAAAGIALVRFMALLGFRALPLYFLIGAVVWLGVDASGVHATITGVVLGLMTPAHRWVSDKRLYAILGQVVAHPDADEDSGGTRDRETLQVAEVAAREALSPVERLEIMLHPWVGFVIMPLFALANAGVTLSLESIDSGLTIAVLVAMAAGKPMGVLAFGWLAVRSGIAARPPELSWGLLAGGGLLAGMGFTMALLIADLSFGPGLVESAKLGIFLSSGVAAVAGLALLTWVTAGRGRAAPPP